MTKEKTPTTAAFVSQKGGVGKSTLARLLAVGAMCVAAGLLATRKLRAADPSDVF